VICHTLGLLADGCLQLGSELRVDQGRYRRVHRRVAQRSGNVPSTFRVSPFLTRQAFDLAKLILHNPCLNSKPLGPAEFLPVLLSVINPSPSHPIPSKHLASLPFQQLLADLASKFSQGEEFANEILSPIFSLLLQEFWNGKREDNQDLGGDGWRTYLSAIGRVAEVKEVASLVRASPYVSSRASPLSGADRSVPLDSCPLCPSGSSSLLQHLRSSLCLFWVLWPG
jgi:hypothetical protein